jgi:isocitrate dehydrogenase (NAD+)
MKEQQKNIITVMRGDQTGQELLEKALEVINPEVTGVPITITEYDLSLQNRKKTKNKVVNEAAQSMRETGLGLKAATITPEKGGLRSPNAILRSGIDGKVILRTGRFIDGVESPLREPLKQPTSIVRMAIGDAYDAHEWRYPREGKNNTACRRESIKRGDCTVVAEFAFQLAEKENGVVFGGPKYTVSPIYEGMFKEEMDDAAQRHGNVEYDPQLIDATHAMIFSKSDKYRVVPALNRDGDCLSDVVGGIYGSLGSSESTLMSFDENLKPKVVMTEAIHGTAPSLEGKDVANPMAMILAGATLLEYIPDTQAQKASKAIKEAVFEAVKDGIKTRDLGGNTSTTVFTQEVIDRTKGKLGNQQIN